MRTYSNLMQSFFALATIAVFCLGGWWLFWALDLAPTPPWVTQPTPQPVTFQPIRATVYPTPDPSKMPVGPGGKSADEHWKKTSTPVPMICGAGSWNCNVDIPNTTFFPNQPGEQGVDVKNGPLVVGHFEVMRAFAEYRANPNWTGAFAAEKPEKRIVSTARISVRPAVILANLKFRIEELGNDTYKLVVKIPAVSLDSGGPNLASPQDGALSNPLQIWWEPDPDYRLSEIYWCDQSNPLVLMMGTCDMISTPNLDIPGSWEEAKTKPGAKGWLNDLVMGEVAAQNAVIETMRVIDESPKLREQYKSAVLGVPRDPNSPTPTPTPTPTTPPTEELVLEQYEMGNAHDFLYTHAAGVVCIIHEKVGRVCDLNRWQIVFEVEEAPAHLSYTNGNPFYAENTVEQQVKDLLRPTATPTP